MTDRTHPDSGRIITSGDVIAELHDRIAGLEAQLEAVGAGGVGPLVRADGFSADDMATAAAQGYRDGAAEIDALKGQRRVLCDLLRECLPIIDAMLQMPGDDASDAPYPGMISAFERYYSQSFTDKDWRNEASVWAAAWKQALLTAAAPTTQPSTTPQADSQPTPVQDYPPLPESIKYGQLDHSSGAYGYRPQDMRAYVDADRAAQEGKSHDN